MKTLRLPLFPCIALIAAALSACGGAVPEPDAPVARTAAVVHVVDLSVDSSATGRTPAPDCAAEGCSGLRIVDGNAEAYRINAMRRPGQGD